MNKMIKGLCPRCGGNCAVTPDGGRYEYSCYACGWEAVTVECPPSEATLRQWAGRHFAAKSERARHQGTAARSA